MKKIIKIFSLIIFIIFVLGITTSRAEFSENNWTMGGNTTTINKYNASSKYDVVINKTDTETLISKLNDANTYITSISDSDREYLDFLICRERGWALSETARYELAAGATTYPGSETNGYAKAYILAAPGYIKSDISTTKTTTITAADERQWAWYVITGQVDTSLGNDLYSIAMEYQNYKKELKDLQKEFEKPTDILSAVDLNKNKQATVSGKNIVYGPIQIKYLYKSMTSGSKFDEWGGFNYAFFDKNGTNIGDEVTLCTLKNGTYTPIISTKISSNDETNGYYKVRTMDYNGDLYIVTTIDKDISSVTLKIQGNDVDYSATVYPIRGEYILSRAIIYCEDCWNDIEAKQTTSLKKAIDDTNYFYKKTWVSGSQNSPFNFDKDIDYYYKFDHSAKETIKGVQEDEKVTNICRLITLTQGNVEIANEFAYAQGPLPEKTISGLYCKYENCTETLDGTNKDNITHYHGQYVGYGWKCYACGAIVDGYWDDTSKLVSHFRENHIGYLYNVTIMKYYFKYFDGCGEAFEQKVSACGTPTQPGYWHSQGLYIIYKTSEEKNNNGEEFTIELLTSIEVTKKWDDYSNARGVRPSDIELTVYRSIDKANWTKLTENTDYNLTWKTETGDVWKGIIGNLKRTDDNGNLYYYKVVEKADNYYNETYSSGGNTNGLVDDTTNKITITNTLKQVNIDIIKNWNDYSDQYNLRPDSISFNVFRSTDQANWTKLTENTDYKVTWTTDTGDIWRATIGELLGVDENGNPYYFKVEEQALVSYIATYPSGQIVQFDETNTAHVQITINNGLQKIDIGGYVWLDEQTGIKPVLAPNGLMDDSETRMKDIVVYLYYKDPTTQTASKVAETVTDENGHYVFEEQEIGYYYVEFEYDGVHYENTVAVQDGSSKAFETDADRNTFNGRFETITYKQSNDGTILDYDYADRKSTLITNEEDSTKIKAEFIMNANTTEDFYSSDVDDLNLGLVKRGTDLALSTDVYDAKVTINGQETDYTFNKDENSVDIGTTQTNEEVSYNLNLYVSDYNYRVRDYVNTQDFKEKDYINDGNSGITTGDDLKVYVTYELNLQNQSAGNVRINEVKYIYDEKYTFVGLTDSSYAIQESGNVITIDLNSLSLTDGETKTLYLVFEVDEINNAVKLGDFSNKAEITSYSTDEGLIDNDSQPGNFVNDNEVEDDSDTAAGLTITVPSDFTRTITGKVFDEDGNNVNDVIVQLIELKTVNGKVYEYIWQETVSGTNSGYRLNMDGTALETYSYTEADGYYEFKGFIPGDYIVRFIYGDGTTYDMTGNVIKYNGQDYKSMVDNYYNAEWYNSSSYTQGASVARDNEARRLETMAYSVEIDASKGMLLKLLNNVTVEDLNETEKEILVSTYNNLYDPDITAVTTEVINKLLKEQVLKNTWMCAETSKIKVAVDTENIINTGTSTTVNGTTQNYANNITDINLGLELRPVTQIELKKYITAFRLTAANGQTLVNAYVDVNEYLNGTADISNKIQGIRDNVIILGTLWQYDVLPTDINTTVDGAKLEFEYTLVVKNTGETDYLSTELADAYNNSTTDDYKTYLISKAGEIKDYMRSGAYRTQIGNTVGNSYYVGGTGTGEVLTEVMDIRDYINNDLKFITSGGDVEIDASASTTHRILRDDYSMQTATINTILKTTKTTGKMANNGEVVLYTVTLGKNPISSTGKLDFENYIAEVMSYTNAAGRRAMTSTPGNAEIIDHEHRTGKSHEIDEADTGRIQVGAATGEDERANYIIIIAVVAGMALIATGAFIVKKYVIK